SPVRQTLHHRSIDTADVQISLWERYFDTGFLQGFCDCNGDVTLELKPAILLCGPETEFKLQSAVAKAHKERSGRAREQNSRVRRCYVNKDLQYAIGIRTIGDSDRDIDP